MHHAVAPTLVIPGLIWPSQALRDISQGLATPALCALLGLARRSTRPGGDIDAEFAARCDLATPLPAAALRRLGLGADAGMTEPWICLDPVQLKFVERRLMLGDPGELQLTADEARQLAVSLAPTFSGLGELVVDAADAWHLRLVSTTDGGTLPPLPAMVGTRADLGLGALSIEWRQALNEAQMQLHSHPVNLAREAAGRPAVNSLWPWGAGDLPRSGLTAHALWLTDSLVLAGLARHLGARAGAVPATWNDLIAENGATSPTLLAVLDGLAAPAAAGDALAWRDELEHLERDWFAPLLASVKAGAVGPLELGFIGPRGGWLAQVSNAARWAFWRRPLPLMVLAEP